MRLLFFVLLAAPVSAQVALTDDLRLDVSGGIQPRASLGVDDPDGLDATRYGAGLRRARVQGRLLYRDLAGAEYDVDAASGTVQSVDLFAFVNVSERVQARAGYFVVPQPRAFIGTPYVLIDAVDRAAIAERWGGGTVGGDGRDLGLGVTYASPGVTASAAVHNGAGTLARGAGNYREAPSSASVVNGPETRGLAVSTAASVALGRGLEAGAFAGANAAASPRMARLEAGRSYVTGGAHLYWGADPGSQPVRLKLDALGLRYGADAAGEAQEAAGVAVFGAVRVFEAGEAFARAERYWSDVGLEADDYLTAGLSVSPSAARGGAYHRARLTLAYGYRGGGPLPDAHLVALQGQLTL